MVSQLGVFILEMRSCCNQLGVRCLIRWLRVEGGPWYCFPWQLDAGP